MQLAHAHMPHTVWPITQPHHTLFDPQHNHTTHCLTPRTTTPHTVWPLAQPYHTLFDSSHNHTTHCLTLNTTTPHTVWPLTQSHHTLFDPPHNHTTHCLTPHTTTSHTLCATQTALTAIPQWHVKGRSQTIGKSLNFLAIWLRPWQTITYIASLTIIFNVDYGSIRRRLGNITGRRRCWDLQVQEEVFIKFKDEIVPHGHSEGDHSEGAPMPCRREGHRNPCTSIISTIWREMECAN